jgi:hypothetical protein
MSEFVESKASGRYPSGLPYTPFHKKEQESDNMIGKDIIKAAFWRALSYLFIFAGLFFSLILLLTIFSPLAPLQILEVTPKGKVLFWGYLKTPPIMMHEGHNLSLNQWQQFIDQKFHSKVK